MEFGGTPDVLHFLSDSDPAPTPEEDETVSLIATLENEGFGNPEMRF